MNIDGTPAAARDGTCWRRGGMAVLWHPLIVCALLAVGCANHPEPEQLLKMGEAQLLEGQWHTAMKPLKQCLLLEPGHPGAHFYLGRAYLNARYRNRLPAPRLVMAVGELQTALACFHARDRRPPLERYTADEFEVLCHVYMAQAHLRKLEFGITVGMPLKGLAATFEDLLSATDAARAIMPASQDVAYLDDLIAQLKESGID
jgi:hypothetical protein